MGALILAVPDLTLTGPAAVTTAAPAITTQPTGVTAVVGQAASFLVVTTGTPSPIYPWRKSGAALAGKTNSALTLASVALAGDTSAELSVSAVSLATAGAYRVTGTGTGGTTTSATVAVTVSNRAAMPFIVAQPAPQTGLGGGTGAFSVGATGNPAPAFQWRKDGADLSGATAATFRLANAQAADAGGYEVVVRNAAGAATSSLASLAVTTRATAPVISRQLADRTLGAGRAAVLFVAATGAPETAYQWSNDSVAHPGATPSALVWSAVTVADSGRSTVAVANSAGSVTSATAVLTVLRSSYAGSWFGSRGTGGTFALRVNDDNTAVLLGFAPGSRTAYVGRTGSLDGNGRFRFTVAATPGGPATAGAPVEGFGSLGAAPAVAEMTFEGTMGDDGALSGSLSGPTPVPLTAARANAAGATAAVAGFYVASAAGSSAQTSGIVGPAGQAFVLTQTGATFDGGAGSVDATGRIAVTTAAPQTFTVTVSAELARITAAMTDAKGTTTQFAGFGAHAPALGEQRLVNLSTRTTAGAGTRSRSSGSPSPESSPSRS